MSPNSQPISFTIESILSKVMPRECAGSLGNVNYSPSSFNSVGTNFRVSGECFGCQCFYSNPYYLQMMQWLTTRRFLERATFYDKLGQTSASHFDEEEEIIDVVGEKEEDGTDRRVGEEMARLKPPEWTRRQQPVGCRPASAVLRYGKGQTEELKRFFLRRMFPTSSEFDALAAETGLSKFQVKKWFQNRRAKERRRLQKGPRNFRKLKNHETFSANK